MYFVRNEFLTLRNVSEGTKYIFVQNQEKYQYLLVEKCILSRALKKLKKKKKNKNKK